MNKTLRINSVVTGIVLLLAIVVTIGVEMINRVIQKGLADSASIRVAKTDSCTTAPDTHFVGCSSIL